MFPGEAPRRKLSADYVDHVKKFVPVLRSYDLGRAADHLDQWIEGVLPLAPLADITPSPGYSLTVLQFLTSLPEVLLHSQLSKWYVWAVHEIGRGLT